MEIVVVNAMLGIGRIVLLMVFVWALARFLFNFTPPRWAGRSALAILAVSAFWNITKTNGVRFTLQDEAGSAPVVGGEIKDSRPRLQTDADREAENQSLYEQNRRGE